MDSFVDHHPLATRHALLPEAEQVDAPKRANASAGQGYVHSIETGGTLDGPGIRFVLFLTGCQLRCQYCHNPDSWRVRHGRRMSLDGVLAEIDKYAPFLKRYGGGVTISGGEPLVQYRFVRSILRACRERGLHTALDTNGYLGAHLSDQDLRLIDLVLLDLKAYNSAIHKRVTGVGNAPILEFARRLADLRRPTWVRFVLVPGLTDDEQDNACLAAFTGRLGNVERVEVLPFHKMGEFKWRELDLEYRLTGTQPPDARLLDRVHHQFNAVGLRVY